MRVETKMLFSPNELGVNIIAETFMLGSKPTQTFSGKRKFAEMFPSDDEKKKCKEILVRAKRIYRHPPKEIEVTPDELLLWKKLVHYCMMLVFR